MTGESESAQSIALKEPKTLSEAQWARNLLDGSGSGSGISIESKRKRLAKVLKLSHPVPEIDQLLAEIDHGRLD